MKLQNLTPILYTNDLNETLRFYRQHLGLECIAKEWEWARICNGTICIMISKPNQHLPFDKAHFTGSFYFETSAVEILWNQLKDEVRVAYPMEDFEYGMREFAIFDNNGYLLQFGKELE